VWNALEAGIVLLLWLLCHVVSNNATVNSFGHCLLDQTSTLWAILISHLEKRKQNEI